MDYSYILRKIETAPILDAPFKHILINDLFREVDFARIIHSPEINIPVAADDDELFSILFEHHYKIIKFPGCITNYHRYKRWHKHKKTSHKTNTTCEGFGVVLRLEVSESPAITALQQFLQSKEFINTLAKKFQVDVSGCHYDAGIQKYLDGYEISPHPDIRKKALTYMVNINPDPESAKQEYHTAYLKLKPEWRFISEFWRGNQDLDRCWIPWSWCETEKRQVENNSMVIFSPDDDTLHGVKANYNHLPYQRTQLYGNLWYDQSLTQGTPGWQTFQIKDYRRPATEIIRQMVNQHMPKPIMQGLKRLRAHVTERNI